MLYPKGAVWMAPTLFGLFVAMEVASGQAVNSHAGGHRAWAENIVVPQRRTFAAHATQAAKITRVQVQATILERVATTTLEISFHNPTRRRLQAEVVLPIPDGAAVRGFSFQGAANEPSAELLTKDEARLVYQSLVAKARDPALLEFVGFQLLRSSVFPIEPNSDQKVQLVYEHVLPADGERIDYLLPRSEAADPEAPWSVKVHIRSQTPIATLYSPSHSLETVRSSATDVVTRIAASAERELGSFRLSILTSRREGVAASFLAYPDLQIGGGYFLLMVAAPTLAKTAATAMRREVTLVIDRSGSMAGEKMEQARDAGLQILAGLEENELFNLISFQSTVDSFARKPVPANAANLKAARAYLKSIRAGGGTNLHDALVEALRPAPVEGALPLVLLLTDGQPTVGVVDENSLRQLAVKGNPHHRRIFTFGVGFDVNAPLLDKIAADSRGVSTYVTPKEDVEVKVAAVFRRLTGPVLAEPALNEGGAGDSPTRLHELSPGKLPDLFDGDQLVVLGKYTGESPISLVLEGNFRGTPRRFQFHFDPSAATTRNAFVPRLWAGRRIAMLIDAVRQIGGAPATSHPSAVRDPRLKELVDEIVRLSKDFGILTEYTAFLAREGTDLSKGAALREATTTHLYGRAIATRSGQAAVNQSLNLNAQSTAYALNPSNRFVNADMQEISIGAVRQVADRAFYRRSGRWIDARAVDDAENLTPRRVIEFGSEEFHSLAFRLAMEGRQGTIALGGDLVLLVDGEAVLVKGPKADDK